MVKVNARGFGLPNLSDRAYDIIQEVLEHGVMTGMVNATIQRVPVSIASLASRGVPENLTLPFETNILRAEIQELAQFLHG